MLDHKHHVGQLKKNWGVVTFIIMVVFGAGMVWAYTQREFVEKETFDVHVTAEKEMMDQKFQAQKELIDQKFKNTDQKIDHVDKHLEEIKELLRD